MQEHTTHLTDEELAQYAQALVAGNLNALSPSMRQHVAHCNQCATETLDMAELYEMLNEQKESSKAVRIKKLVYTVSGIAASVILVVAAKMLWISPTGPTGQLADGGVPITQEQTKTADSAQPLMGSGALVHPGLVEQINYDSLTTVFAQNPGEFKVNTPALLNLKKAALPYRMSWEGSDTKNLLWYLRDLRGHLIHQETLSGSGDYILPDTLQPGTYYWELCTAYKRHFCGKIVLEW